MYNKISMCVSWDHGNNIVTEFRDEKTKNAHVRRLKNK